jgi:hypothetical protein
MHGLFASAQRVNRICRADWILALALVTATSTNSIARQPADGGWVGKRVVQKYRDFQLKVERQVIDRKGRLQTYRVEQGNGPWLWLHAPGMSGWALADQIVPVDQAIELFTDYILANPDDAFAFSMRGTLWLHEK